MEIKDVRSNKVKLETNEKITVSFAIYGARKAFFSFPFSNESLTKPFIEFTEEDVK